MKALRTKICTYAIALLVSIGFVTPTLAGSSDFSGIWVAGHAELNVVAIDGTHTQTTDSEEVGQGVIGGFAPTAGWEAGFNFPVGDTFFITVGYADGGGDSAAIAKFDDSAGVADVTLHASDPHWFYIAPSISIFDNSAVYFKIGQADISLKAAGDLTGSAPDSLDGKMYGIGTTTIASNGLFFKTEAGAVLYDEFKITGLAGDANTVVEGEPVVGYGHISIGYKF